MSEAERLPVSVCCFIDPESNRSCEKQAEWHIKNTTEGADPDDDTEACAAHVGALLTEGGDHAVYPIDPA